MHVSFLASALLAITFGGLVLAGEGGTKSPPPTKGPPPMCHQPELWDSSKKACVPCPLGTIYVAGKGPSPPTCKCDEAKSYYMGPPHSQCAVCPPTSSCSKTDPTKCACKPGSYHNYDSNQCLGCPPGSTLAKKPSSKWATCTCPAGSWFDWRTNSCVCSEMGYAFTPGKGCKVGPSQKTHPKRNRNVLDISFGLISSALCPPDHTACPVQGALVPYECVNVMTNLESCGGCSALDGGTDCTGARGVASTACVQGRCEVFSCDRGWAKIRDLAGAHTCIKRELLD